MAENPKIGKGPFLCLQFPSLPHRCCSVHPILPWSPPRPHEAYIRYIPLVSLYPGLCGSVWGGRAETLQGCRPPCARSPAELRRHPLKHQHFGPSLRSPRLSRDHPFSSPDWMARGRRRATSGLSLLVLVRAADASQTRCCTRRRRRRRRRILFPTPFSSDLCLSCSRMPTCQGAALDLRVEVDMLRHLASLVRSQLSGRLLWSLDWRQPLRPHRDQTPSLLHLSPTPPYSRHRQSTADSRTDRRIRDGLGPQSLLAAPAATCLSDLVAVQRSPSWGTSIGRITRRAVPCGPFSLLLLIVARYILINWPSSRPTIHDNARWEPE